MSRADSVRSFGGFLTQALKPELPPVWPFGKPPKSGKANKIAYLDGLRGMAALIVYLTHHAYYAHEAPLLHRAFGWRGQYYFAAAPGVRLFWSGGALSVALFFVISGYVVSLSALNSLHKGDLLKLYNNLGTGLPRRFVRLYFPILCITFIIGTSWHLFGIRCKYRDAHKAIWQPVACVNTSGRLADHSSSEQRSHTETTPNLSSRTCELG